MLLERKAIATAYIDRHLHIDINDKIARQYLPDYKPQKDLFLVNIDLFGGANGSCWLGPFSQTSRAS
jgi:hypothetical protein